MKAISAPYNFVPLNEQVHLPDWGRLVSHDWPFKDGCSGEIHYTLIAESPLLVGGKQEKPPANDRANDRPGTEVKPFRLCDGRYAIPGSSLKGMIRSVVEIAGFGRMRMVDEVRPGLRDISGKYVKRSYLEKVKNVQTGFIQLSTDSQIRLIPCKMARLHHSVIRELGRFSDGDVADKYRDWKDICERNACSVERVSFSLQGQDAINLCNGELKGMPVFTGRMKGKRKEFIFYDMDESAARKVDQRSWRDFLALHGGGSRAERGGDVSGAWRGHWRSRFENGQLVPVFFIQDEAVLRIGLSYLPKLAGDYSTHDCIDNVSEDHLRSTPGVGRYDLADLLFGSVNSEVQEDALRARVSFEVAVAENDPKSSACDPTILSSPKPSYFPNYLCQDAGGTDRDRQTRKNEQYITYVSSKGSSRPRVRGFKRYPVRPDEMVGVQTLTQDQRDNRDVQIRLHTLPKGSRFSGRIVFHNLKPVELGALLWALTWAGDSTRRHSLGMGKSFGFGQVRFEIDEKASYQVTNAKPGKAVSLDKGGQIQLMNAFVDHMNQCCANWEKHPRIDNLLSMADPEAATRLPEGMELRHMQLAKPNKFVEAKKNRLVLADYAEAVRRPGKLPSARPKTDLGLHPWVKERCAEICQKNHCEEHDAMKGKALAEAWSQIDDPELRKATWESIRAYWQAKGWWDAPQGKAMKVARKVYGDAP